MYDLTILPAAKKDIKEAALWYNKQQTGLGKRFTRKVREKTQFIKENPLIYATRYANIQTAIVKGFPYMIHFSVVENKIIIYAVLSTHRDPTNWSI